MSDENSPAPSPAAPYAREICEALGLSTAVSFRPRLELGESPTRLLAWDVTGLRDIYARTGGTVTCKQAENAAHTVELTLTVDVAGIGPVEVATDWNPVYDPAYEGTWRRELAAASALMRPTDSDAVQTPSDEAVGTAGGEGQ